MVFFPVSRQLLWFAWYLKWITQNSTKGDPLGRQGVDPLKVGAATGLHGVLSSKSLTTMVCMIFKTDNSKWYKWGPFGSTGVQIPENGGRYWFAWCFFQ